MVSSKDIKYALLNYFRFKRQWVCADEVMNGVFIADVLVDNNVWTMEVEVKVSKQDLIIGESKKTTGWRGRGKKKHEEWPDRRTNKFALCVPESLLEVAEKWIKDTNPKYGLFLYLPSKVAPQDRIRVIKTAKSLHNNYNGERFKQAMLKRLSCLRALTIKKEKTL